MEPSFWGISICLLDLGGTWASGGLGVRIHTL